jgi:hypothetical protein
MRLVDSWTDAGRPSNEDALGSTCSAAWVIDGTKGPFEHILTPGPMDATWYSQLLNSCLLEYFAAAANDPMSSLAKMSAYLCETYIRSSLAAPPHEQPSACLALVSLDVSGGVHLLNIGDCRILIETGGRVRQFGSSDIQPLEAAAIAELVPLRESGADTWPRLRATFKRNFEGAMNKPGGYWVTHPTLPWLIAVQHRALPRDEVDHILLASDGFFRLVNVFGAYDEAGLVAAARAGGLAALGAELRAIESEDPNCLRYPRLKFMDDASAILVRNGP